MLGYSKFVVSVLGDIVKEEMNKCRPKYQKVNLDYRIAEMMSPSRAPVFFLCPLLPSACYAGYSKYRLHKLMVSKGLEETSKSSLATRRLLCHCGVNKFKRAVEGKLKTKANDPPNNTFMLKVYFEKKYDVCVVKYFESYF